MTNSPDKNQLYIALSDIFVDTMTDYQYIVSVAKSFPIEDVEEALFRYVAPVCHWNLCCPIPPIWTGFDEKDLLDNINQIKIKEKSFYGKVKLNLFSHYLRFTYRRTWNELKDLIYCNDIKH